MMALDTFALYIHLPPSSPSMLLQLRILSAPLTWNCSVNKAFIKTLRTSQEVQCGQELNTALVVTGLGQASSESVLCWMS